MKKTRTRLLAILLVFVMALGMLPMTALADYSPPDVPDEYPGEYIETNEQEPEDIPGCPEETEGDENSEESVDDETPYDADCLDGYCDCEPVIDETIVDELDCPEDECECECDEYCECDEIEALSFGLYISVFGTYTSSPDWRNATGEIPEVTSWEFDDNNLWLQYDFKELEIGDTARIHPRRVVEAISNPFLNDVQWPNFNYTIIAGDSVELTSIEPHTISANAGTGGAIFTAVRPGVTLIRVTYNAFTHSGNSRTYPAMSPVNASYVALVVVDDENVVDSGMTINFNDELRLNYDTVYFLGSHAEHTINPTVTGADSYEVFLNGVPVTGSGTYTLHLQNRQNIVGIRAVNDVGAVRYAYRMIDARRIEVNVINESRPGEPVAAGDTARVSFNGIRPPVYKLATIYNPILGSSAFVEYTSPGLGIFQGRSAQYDLATRNSFTVSFARAGTFTFTSPNGINQSWFGHPLGHHYTLTGLGNAIVGGAVTRADWFSVMPDFTITVAPSATPTQNRYEPAPSGVPGEGWFIIYNPEGNLLQQIEVLLQAAPFNQQAGNEVTRPDRPLVPGNIFNPTPAPPPVAAVNPRGFDYYVVKNLRVVGEMTNADFFGNFGLRQTMAVPTDNNHTRLFWLEELDLSTAALPNNTLPHCSMAGLANMTTLRLPTGARFATNTAGANASANMNMFNGCIALNTIVFGTGSAVVGTLDFSGSGITQILSAAPNQTPGASAAGLRSPDIKRIVFPYNVTLDNNAFSWRDGITEVVFPGGTTIGTGVLSSSASTIEYARFYRDTAPTIAAGLTTFLNTVAYVPDPTSGGYELPAFYERFLNVRQLPGPDLTQLNAAIAIAEARVEANYRAATWLALQITLVEATSIRDFTRSTQIAVDAARDALQDVLDALVNISALTAAIEAAEALNFTGFTSASWSAMQTALSNARNARDDVTVTQTQVANAANALTAAINGLVTSGGTGGNNQPGGINVTFRLIGATRSESEICFMFNGFDDLHGSEYVTWIPTTSYQMAPGSRVYDLFMRAISDAGLAADVSHMGNYVSAIRAPAVLGGQWLREMDNGPRSGWMYTVNGNLVDLGLGEQTLQNGDIVIWFFVNDFLYEVRDWFDGSLGNASVWDRWLLAPDSVPTAPPAGNQGGRDGDTTFVPEDIPTEEITNPRSTGQVSNAVSDALEYLQDSDSEESAIALLLPEDGDGINFSSDTLETLVNAEVDLFLLQGSVTLQLSPDALAEISERTEGTVSLNFEARESDYGLAAFDISIVHRGGAEIRELDAPIIVAVNVESAFAERGANANSRRVVAVLDDGTIVAGTLDLRTGKFVFETTVTGSFTIKYIVDLTHVTLQIGSTELYDVVQSAITHMDVVPLIEESTALVPVRFLAYALGASVDWNGDLREVTLTLGDRALTFGIGETAPGMDVPAQIIENRTMVPLRFISEFFGATVNWSDYDMSIEVLR